MSLKTHDNIFFLRKLIKNPKSVGAIAPSSKKLGLFMARFVLPDHDGYILELGAGMGSLTKCLLKGGVRPERLILVELDEEMCRILRDRFPGVLVIHGDASQLKHALPAPYHQKIKTVISGIPMVNLSLEEQRLIIEGTMAVMDPGGQFLQFTYGPLSPLPAKKLGLKQRRLGHVFFNVPPATVWCYIKGDGEFEDLPVRLSSKLRIKHFLKAQTQSLRNGRIV